MSLDISKAVGYAVTTPQDLSVSKAVGYAVTTPQDLSVSKVIVYAVLQQEVTKNASICLVNT
jgi:hypothetical protein